MKTILITGISGFIGRSIYRTFLKDYKIIAFSRQYLTDLDVGCIQVNGNIEDNGILKDICDTYRPDIVIHCAGLAHQKLANPLDKEKYEKINCLATEHLAKAAAQANPEVWFIFLSSISVYGEKQKKENVQETDPCLPTSDYALSKLNAEKKLKRLYESHIVKKFDILRLAPVYDWNWSLNIDKRVFAPCKLFYLKYGSGEQTMSVINRNNLADFIEFRLKNNEAISFFKVFNICDKIPCSFNEIINVFKKSALQPNRITIRLPLIFVWFLTKIAGLLIKQRKAWVLSIYDKLANNLTFANEQMLKTGFRPKHNIHTVFSGNNLIGKNK